MTVHGKGLGHTEPYFRYFPNLLNVPFIKTVTLSTAARVQLVPIEIPFDIIVDRICVPISNVTAGNIVVGIYRDNGDTPDGGALVVESASVAAAAANEIQEVTIASTLLTKGLYWIAIENDDNTLQIGGPSWSTFMTGGTLTSRFYDRAGGYGALTDPCPATAASTKPVYLFTRVE